MKKYFVICLLFIVLLGVATINFAEEQKTKTIDGDWTRCPITTLFMCDCEDPTDNDCTCTIKVNEG